MSRRPKKTAAISDISPPNIFLLSGINILGYILLIYKILTPKTTEDTVLMPLLLFGNCCLSIGIGMITNPFGIEDDHELHMIDTSHTPD